MSRKLLLALSVLDCAFGLTALYTDGAASSVAYGLNFVLAAVLAMLTWQDLRSRGWTWQSVVSVTYVLAPLVGLVLYAALSSRPKLPEGSLVRS